MSSHITLSMSDGTWVLRAGGAVLGETTKALELREGDQPPVIYFPRQDIAMALLDRSETTSVCPHKGDATYYSIQTKSDLIADAAWSYETPQPDVMAIKNHLAFFTDKVTLEEI